MVDRSYLGPIPFHQAVIELYVKACLSMVPQLRGLLSVCMAIKSGLGGGAGVVFAGEVHMGAWGPSGLVRFQVLGVLLLYYS